MDCVRRGKVSSRATDESVFVQPSSKASPCHVPVVPMKRSIGTLLHGRVI